MSMPAPAEPHKPSKLDWRAYLELLRVDYWFKNVFVLPGIVAAAGIDRGNVHAGLFWRIAVGLLAICLTASSNYVLNEVIDAPFDKLHPTKYSRPAVAGRIHTPVAMVLWLALAVVGIFLGWVVSRPLAGTLAALWIMGCAYNVPPVRTKDVPYLDVLTEAVNNPLRLLAGWFITTSRSIAPASLLFSYWMLGCFFMALKRYAECRTIGDRERAAAYRRSFRVYTPESLLVSVMFYTAAAMLFFGAFIMRYRLELILAAPFIAWLMAAYLSLSFRTDSAVQQPERLYREPRLMVPVVLCGAAITILCFVDMPFLQHLFNPTAPTQPFNR